MSDTVRPVLFGSFIPTLSIQGSFYDFDSVSSFELN